MLVRPLPASVLIAVAATTVAAGAGSTATAARDTRPPRVVTAAMVDADGDFRADRLRLTYSERVRHAADADGRYPFAVAGYKVRSVAAASGKTVVIALTEKTAPDDAARPFVLYRRTRAKPVRDHAGNQALGQRFTRVRAHGHRPPDTPPPPPTTDRDRDGVPDTQDCAPDDAAIKPGAPDTPDLRFVDSVGAGGDGGFGGSGGRGGAGGGGAGGPSVGIFRAGISTATLNGGSKVANGSGGPGGGGPGNPGAVGIAQPVHDTGP